MMSRHPVIRDLRVLAQPASTEGDTLVGNNKLDPSGSPKLSGPSGQIFDNADLDHSVNGKEVKLVGLDGKLVAKLNGEDGHRFAPAQAQALPPTDPVNEAVVDLGKALSLEAGANIKVRQHNVTEQDLSIQFRNNAGIASILDSIQIINRQEREGFIKNGTHEDIIRILDGERPFQKGIICDNKTIHCNKGMYREGFEYQTLPVKMPSGAFGEVNILQDKTTQKAFVRKKVQGKFCKNEVKILLEFKNCPGIPDLYGIVFDGENTVFYQQFAGLSLRVLRQSPDAVGQLKKPVTVMLIGCQLFGTLQSLHKKNIRHLDIKPENVCQDNSQNIPLVKLIDFGSAKTTYDEPADGLTKEYLSPESCNAILKGAFCDLRPSADVWAAGLVLAFCLFGIDFTLYMQKLLNWKNIIEEIRNLDDNKVHFCLGCLMQQSQTELPDCLKALLCNTLRVDPKLRWGAGDAADFAHKQLEQMLSAQANPAPQTMDVTKPEVASLQSAKPEVPVTKAVPQEKASTVANVGFMGLTPPRLVLRQPKPEPVPVPVPEPVQCSSPSPSPSPMQCVEAEPSTSNLPDFDNLLGEEPPTTTTHTRCPKQRYKPYNLAGGGGKGGKK